MSTTATATTGVGMVDDFGRVGNDVWMSLRGEGVSETGVR